MSLHAGVAVPANDRRRLVRLCHYVSRPPLANDRLEERPDDTLALRLKTPWRDGTTHVVMERSELLDRVIRGAQADDSAGRGRAERDPEPNERASDVAGNRSPDEPRLDESSPFGVTSEAEWANRATEGSPGTNTSRADTRRRARRLRGAALLQRVFRIDALRCPHCGSTMRLLAVIEDPVVARKILARLDLPARAPPLGLVSGDPRASVDDEAPTEDDRDLDQAPVDDDP